MAGTDHKAVVTEFQKTNLKEVPQVGNLIQPT